MCFRACCLYVGCNTNERKKDTMANHTKPVCGLCGGAWSDVHGQPGDPCRTNPTVCCIAGCDSPARYTNVEGDVFCWPCADGDRPAPPKDENGTDGERVPLLDRIRETNQAYDKVRETLDGLRTALYDAEKTLDRAARPDPTVIRQAALSEAWDALLAAGHVAAGNVIANMLREDRLKDGANR